MRRRVRCGWSALGCILALAAVAGWGQAQLLTPPVVGETWVQPSIQAPAQPVWGHAYGLRVGLWPMPGPRGLLRIYAPYLGHAHERVVNYIAIEPVVSGTLFRSYSELETSQLDLDEGLRFWSASEANETVPCDPAEPTRGEILMQDGVEILRVYIHIEAYRSGAIVSLSLTFRADRPYEVGIATLQAMGSKPLAACIVTATMGNYARLRTLHLSERTVDAAALWPTFDGSGFTTHACFAIDELIRARNGDVWFVATPDEVDPERATYAPGTFMGWKYNGLVATQTWRREAPRLLMRGCVNARTQYWASQSPIPGGIAFENFELVEPFESGATFWFGVWPGCDLSVLPFELD